MKNKKKKKDLCLSKLIDDLRSGFTKEELQKLDLEFWEYLKKKDLIIEEVDNNVRYCFGLYEPIN